MTSLKRPFEYELASQPHQQQQQQEIADSAAGSSVAIISGPTTTNGPVANGGGSGIGSGGDGCSKRRCNQTAPSLLAGSDSPFKDSSNILSPLSEDVAAIISKELQKSTTTTAAATTINSDDQCIKAEEQEQEQEGGGEQQQQQQPASLPLLTVRQTQLICEKLVKDREIKLREEYDRILARKLAEQYDLLTKANYLNNFAATITAANGHPSALTTTQLAYNLQQQTSTNPAAIHHQHHQVHHQATANAAAAAAVALQQQQQHHHNHHQQSRILPVSAAVAAAAAAAANSAHIPSGPVLLASNLDEQLAVPEALFTLFGVFGDVIRVKILFNKKDNALIQMAESNQAQVAQGYLDKQKVFGKVIRVTRSKHQLVQMPRESNQSDAGLTKDFTNSPLHRFKIPGSRNYLNIYPPSNTLHISNIPATLEENDIYKAFREACGFEYSLFKFFPKDRKMALMKFNSIEHATIALVKMHNFQVSEDNHLRVSFSKSVMQG